MDRKIELVQEENCGGWHWIILEYDNQAQTWHNVGCGLEESYTKASVIAKKEYDLLQNNKVDNEELMLYLIRTDGCSDLFQINNEENEKHLENKNPDAFYYTKKL